MTNPYLDARLVRLPKPGAIVLLVLGLLPLIFEASSGGSGILDLVESLDDPWRDGPLFSSTGSSEIESRAVVENEGLTLA